MKLHWTSKRELPIQVEMNFPNLMRSVLYGINWVELNIAKSAILLGMEICDSSIYTLIPNTKLDLKKNEIIMGRRLVQISFIVQSL